MNDASFIIISSDEESNPNNVPKTDEVSSINKRNIEAVEHEADSSDKQYSKIKLTEQEKSQCCQTSLSSARVAHGRTEFPSENPKLYISKQSQGASVDSQVLRNSKYWTEDDEIKNEAKSDCNTHNENNKTQEMSYSFNKFLQLVLPMEEKEDDRAKLLKKITKYHNLADPHYLKSDELNNLLERSMNKLSKDQAFLYFVIKEVLDCLLSKRVLTEHKNIQNEKSSDTAKDSTKKGFEEGGQMDEVDVFSNGDVKNYKTIKKLTKVLRKLEKKIKELEETEVDLSDEEDSVYLKMQRYRERYCKIYKKLCTYSKEAGTAKLTCRSRITFSGTNNIKLDRAIERWLNKTMEFPDYASVLKFVGESNENLQLGMSEEVLKKLAIDVFVKIGNSLQLRRKYDLWDSLNPFLEGNIDPSANDSELKERLESNYEIAVEKEREILNYYADLQTKRSLQPSEVPDEEANESPVESGDEDEKELEAIENDLSCKVPVEIDGNVIESEAEENDEGCNSPIESDHEATNPYSEISKASLTPECVPSCSDNDKNVASRKNGSKKNEEDTKFSGSINKRKEKDDDNNESTVVAVNELPEIENRKCVKKAKVTKGRSRDEDSDCELVVLVSDEEASFKCEKDNNCKVRKVFQVNYAFINNNFNHNAAPTTEDHLVKRKNSSFCFKSGKTQRKSLSLPLSDLTNIKHITNKCARSRGPLEKRKFQDSTRLHPFEKLRFTYSHLILLGKRSNHCALQNESSNKKLNSQNESDQAKEKDSCEQSSNDERISGPNGASGGGSGEGNNEDDGKKKPYGKEGRMDDNQGTEDEDEDIDGDKAEKEEFSKNEGDSTAGESNSAEPVKRQSLTERSGIPTKGEYVAGSSQLQNCRMDPPQSKNKCVTTKGKRIMGNKIRVQKKGVPPGTSRFASVLTGIPRVENVESVGESRKQEFPSNLPQVDMFSVNKKSELTSLKISKSDEEIVKNFLQHSPSSISITSPRKRPIENKPSPSVVQAIQTLSRLKGITTTMVKASCPQREKDIVVVAESSRSRQKRTRLPTSKSSRSQNFVLPKIVSVQGNVSGFENMDSGSVVANFSDNKTPSPKRRRNRPSHSHITTHIPGNSDNAQDVRTTRESSENVEYVVVD